MIGSYDIPNYGVEHQWVLGSQILKLDSIDVSADDDESTAEFEFDWEPNNKTQEGL